MPWSLSPSHHGIEHILDEAGEVIATVEYDPIGAAWDVTADRKRFWRRDDLPAVFDRRYMHEFKRRGDLLRFFGIALPAPGEGSIQSDVLTAGRRAA